MRLAGSRKNCREAGEVECQAVEGERRQVVSEALNDSGQLIQRNRVRPVVDTRPVAGEIDDRFLYPGLT